MILANDGRPALTWRQYTAAERAWHTAYERIAETAERSAERSRSRDQGYGLEL